MKFSIILLEMMPDLNKKCLFLDFLNKSVGVNQTLL